MSGAIPAAKEIKDPSVTRYPSKSVVVTSPAFSMGADQTLDAAQISASLILAKTPEEESLNSRNHLRT